MCEQRVSGYTCLGPNKCVLAKILDIREPGSEGDVRNYLGVSTSPDKAPNYSGCMNYATIMSIENRFRGGKITRATEQQELRRLHDSKLKLKNYPKAGGPNRTYYSEQEIVDTNPLNHIGNLIGNAWQRFRNRG